MMRTVSFLVGLVQFVTCMSGACATYYMATNGNDSATGLTTNTPWQTLNQAASSMQAGDTLYIRGGVYDGNVQYQYFGLGLYAGIGVSGTPTAPIVISNYSGEMPRFVNCNPTGNGVGPISIANTAWIKIFGLSVSNSAVHGISLGNSTNCELAYCTVEYLATNAWGQLLWLDDGAKFNYIHNNVFRRSWSGALLGTNQSDNSDCAVLGGVNWPWSTNGCNYNVLASNSFSYGGHTVININGDYNAFIGNTYHNEPWIWWPAFQQYGGHRCIGSFGAHCLFDSETAAFAGEPLANDGASGMEIMGGSNIIRHCAIYWNENWGINLYEKAVGDRHPNYNHIYNNTLCHNAMGQMYLTNYAKGKVYNWSGSKAVMVFNTATNNRVINNIFAYNGANQFYGYPTNAMLYGGPTNLGPACEIWGPNWTNNVQGDPLFVSDDTVNPWTNSVQSNLFNSVNITNWPNYPNYHLGSLSRCIDAGGWLTTIVSPSGSGTNFTVADPGFFWPGVTAAGAVFPGDTIQLQGQTVRSTITAIDYRTGVLTLSSSLSWTNGQGVALAYNGSAPDMGAYEYGGLGARPDPPVPPYLVAVRLVTNAPTPLP